MNMTEYEFEQMSRTEPVALSGWADDLTDLFDKETDKLKKDLGKQAKDFVDEQTGTGKEIVVEQMEELKSAVDTPVGETPSAMDKAKSMIKNANPLIVGGGTFAVAKFGFGLGLITSTLAGVGTAGLKYAYDQGQVKETAGSLADCNCTKY